MLQGDDLLLLPLSLTGDLSVGITPQPTALHSAYTKVSYPDSRLRSVQIHLGAWTPCRGWRGFYLRMVFIEDWYSIAGVCYLSFFGILTVNPSCRAGENLCAGIINPPLQPRPLSEVGLELGFIGVYKAQDILPPTEFWVTKFL